MDENWIRLPDIVEGTVEGIPPQSRHDLARWLFDGAIKARARTMVTVFRSLQFLPEPYQELPPRQLVEREYSDLVNIHPAYWGAEALGNLDGEWWTNGCGTVGATGSVENTFYAIEVNRDDFRSLSLVTPPPLHEPSMEEVVNWCRAWITSGNKGGQNAAWAAFHAKPEHANRNREHWFRPAWNQAAGREIT